MRAGLLRRPREDVPVLLARSVTGAVMTTGMPEGAWAPVIRLSSASPERTWVTCGVIPACAIRRVISRRWLGRTRVTTRPDSPARAVRPPRCR